jgi:hypothetical protein
VVERLPKTATSTPILHLHYGAFIYNVAIFIGSPVPLLASMKPYSHQDLPFSGAPEVHDVYCFTASGEKHNEGLRSA